MIAYSLEKAKKLKVKSAKPLHPCSPFVPRYGEQLMSLVFLQTEKYDFLANTSAAGKPDFFFSLELRGVLLSYEYEFSLFLFFSSVCRCYECNEG